MSYPVTFLLGAGASFPYGIPLMTGFYTEFRSYVEQRHSHCLHLIEKLEGSGRHSSFDLETLLSDLESLLGAAQALALIGAESGVAASQIEVARELRGYLDAFIVDTCERFDRKRAVADFKALLDLRSFGPLYVFTTNYDRIVETACAEHGIAYSDGFESQAGQPVADWTGRFETDVRIVKLHGSVNWYVDDPGGALHRLDRGHSLPSYEFRLVRGSQVLKPLMIIPTLEKEALGPPYIELAMRFTDVLKDTRLLIVTGNSLRDRHIRSYIQGRLDNLQVLLVSPLATQGVNIVANVARTHALDTGFSEFLTLGQPLLHRLVHDLSTADSCAESTVSIVHDFIAGVSGVLQDEHALTSNPELARIWHNTSASSVSVRANAMNLLAEHSHPAIVRRVIDVARTDEAEVVRVAAVTALVHLGGSGVIDTLGLILTTDKSRMVQMESALGLGRLTSHTNAVTWLQRARERSDLASVARGVIEEVLRSTGESVAEGTTA